MIFVMICTFIGAFLGNIAATLLLRWYDDYKFDKAFEPLFGRSRE